MARKILIFGGNGFMGGETVVELLELKQFDITVVNRGNWDNYDAKNRIRPFVKRIRFDREKSDAVENLRVAIGEARFDAIIDFSAYDSDVIADALTVLEGRFQLYIYISTDSVYEVCVPSEHVQSSEVDSIRPSDPHEYQRLKRKDSYGHKKLKAEECLIEYKKQSKYSWSYVILRLPDVLGPRDSTDRWWLYQMWIQFYDSIGKPLEVSTDLPTSYVYVIDVSRYIIHIIRSTIIESSDVFNNQILNISCVETVSIRELLGMIMNELGFKNHGIPIVLNSNTDADFFPSITRGPVNVLKALSEPFQWKPTPIQQVVRETVRWYNDAYRQYPNECKEIIKRIRKTLFKDDQTTYEKLKLEIERFSTESTIKRKREDDPTI